MSLPDVGKSSLFYSLVYWPVYSYFNLYYRKFTVTGRENVPANKPVIFAGNHQNALMDALSILFAARGKVAFLARADLFRKKSIARILFFFRILPAYRLRDGISSMGQNEASFQRAADVLRNGTPLALFPEGNHSGFKRLRQLKKGICRIAFMAEEKAGYNLDLHIVPSGIDYSNYSDPGSQLLVNYGKPIRVADFIPLYRENPQKALSALRDKLSEALEPLMINIPDEENYPLYMDICSLYRYDLLQQKNLPDSHPNRLLADREIISALKLNLQDKHIEVEGFRQENSRYQELLSKYGLRDWLLSKKSAHIPKFLLAVLLALLFLPLFLYGLLLNYLPFKLPMRFTRNVKDHVFHSSIHFGIGLFLFPLYYLILLLIFLLAFKAFLPSLLFLVSLPLSGIATFHYYKHLLKLRGRFRLLKLRMSAKNLYTELVNLRQQLISNIHSIINI